MFVVVWIGLNFELCCVIYNEWGNCGFQVVPEIFLDFETPVVLRVQYFCNLIWGNI